MTSHGEDISVDSRSLALSREALESCHAHRSHEEQAKVLRDAFPGLVVLLPGVVPPPVRASLIVAPWGYEDARSLARYLRLSESHEGEFGLSLFCWFSTLELIRATTGFQGRPFHTPVLVLRDESHSIRWEGEGFRARTKLAELATAKSVAFLGASPVDASRSSFRFVGPPGAKTVSLDPSASDVLLLPRPYSKSQPDLEGDWLVVLVAIWSATDVVTLRDLVARREVLVPAGLRLAIGVFEAYEEVLQAFPDAEHDYATPFWLFVCDGRVVAQDNGPATTFSNEQRIVRLMSAL